MIKISKNTQQKDSKANFLAYTDLDQVILSVGLVKPKEDVFVDTVKYILVIATTVEIIILAVVFEEDKISLLPCM